MKMYSLLPFILAVSTFAQSAPKPVEKPEVKPVAAQTPTLTTTEQIAARELANEFDQLKKAIDQVNGEVASFQEDVKKAHPGFEFDLQQHKLVAIPPEASDTKGK